LQTFLAVVAIVAKYPYIYSPFSNFNTYFHFIPQPQGKDTKK
jgi:hypothetical protein